MSLSARFDQLQKKAVQRKQEEARAAQERDPEFVMTYDDNYLATQYGDDAAQQNGRRGGAGGHELDEDDDEALPRGSRRRRVPPRDRDTGRRARDRSRSPGQRRGRYDDENDFDEPRSRRGNEPYRLQRSRRGQTNGAARRRNPVVVTKAPSSYQPVVIPAARVGILQNPLLASAAISGGRFNPYQPQVITHAGRSARANNTGYARNNQNSTRGRRGNSRGGRGNTRGRGARGRGGGNAPRGTQGRGVGVAVGRGRGRGARGRGNRGGGGGGRGRGGTRGGGRGGGGGKNSDKQPQKSKAALDAELDKFMGKSTDEVAKEKKAVDASKLDADLDSYWKQNESK